MAFTRALLDALWTEQTAALLGPLTENDGCKPVDVYWMENPSDSGGTGETTNHTAITCDFDGGVPASNSASYQITKFAYERFRIPLKDCANVITYEQKYARQMTDAMTKLANRLAGIIPAKLLEYSGVNLDKGKLGTYGVVSSVDDKTLTRLAPGNFNAFDFVPYVEEIAEANGFVDPAVFDGGNLRYLMYNAARQQGTNAGDAGQQNHFQDLRVYEDGLAFRKNGNTLSDSTFIVEKGAIMMYATAFGPTYDDQTSRYGEKKYRLPLLGLTQPSGNGRVPVQVDVIERILNEPISQGSDLCQDYKVFELKVWYLIEKNPLLSVNDGVTGVIRLKSDATLTQKGTPMQKAL